MRKIKNLASYLCNAANLPREKVKSFVQLGEITPVGSDYGFVYLENGEKRRQISIGSLKYDAVFMVEDFFGDATALVAVISAWFATNDPDRERHGLDVPKVDVNFNDPQTCDIDLEAEFLEELILHEAQDGPIEFAGSRWRPAHLEITPVEKLMDMQTKVVRDD